MPLFRNIDYGKMLYEALRNYYSINSTGELTILYKYMACMVQPLQDPFNAYAAQRTINALIAQCKWQIGQLTNVLNMLYDSTLKRIYITQNRPITTQAVGFPYNAITQARGFGEAAILQARGFGDTPARSTVIINIPVVIDIPSITATIEQIRLKGIPYEILTF